MGFLSGIFNKSSSSASSTYGWDNMGIQFFFDFKEFTATGKLEYGRHIRDELLPFISPVKLPVPQNSQIKGASLPTNFFAFYEGNFIPRGQFEMPYDGSSQANVLREVQNRGIDKIYIVAIFGSWLSRPGYPEYINSELMNKRFPGYLGMTYATRMNTLIAYEQLALTMGLTRGGRADGKQFTKDAWSWMNNEKLNQLGFTSIK